MVHGTGRYGPGIMYEDCSSQPTGPDSYGTCLVSEHSHGSFRDMGYSSTNQEHETGNVSQMW